MRLRNFEKIVGILIIALFILNMSNATSVFGLISFLAFLYAIFYFIFGLGIINNKKFKGAFKIESGIGIETGLSIGMSISISSIVLGFLFFHMNFPNVKINGLFGVVTGIIILILTIATKRKINPEVSKEIRKRLALFVIIGLVVVFLPKHTFLKIKHRNNPEFVEAVINAHKNPNDTTLWRKVEELETKMNK